MPRTSPHVESKTICGVSEMSDAWSPPAGAASAVASSSQIAPCRTARPGRPTDPGALSATLALGNRLLRPDRSTRGDKPDQRNALTSLCLWPRGKSSMLGPQFMDTATLSDPAIIALFPAQADGIAQQAGQIGAQTKPVAACGRRRPASRPRRRTILRCQPARAEAHPGRTARGQGAQGPSRRASAASETPDHAGQMRAGTCLHCDHARSWRPINASFHDGGG
jgi:hypothetical protein